MALWDRLLLCGPYKLVLLYFKPALNQSSPGSSYSLHILAAFDLYSSVHMDAEGPTYIRYCSNVTSHSLALMIKKSLLKERGTYLVVSAHPVFFVG